VPGRRCVGAAIRGLAGAVEAGLVGARDTVGFTGWLYPSRLFALIALGQLRLSRAFKAAAVWSAAVNCFDALTFQGQEGNKYYYIEPTQKVIYQPDQ